MKNITFYLLVINVLLLSCSKREIKSNALHVIYSAPLFHESGAKIDWGKEFTIYSTDDAFIYELPYFNKKVTDSVPKIIKKFFIFKKEAESGLMYIPTQSNSPRVFDVDSVLKAETFKGVDVFKIEEETFVSKSESKDNIKEVYVPKVKKDMTFPDTTVVTYSTKKLDLNFSWSRSLEEVKNKTVTKVESVYNPQVVKGVSIPKYQVIFELKVLNVIPKSQLKKVQKYIKKFEEDSKKLLKEKV
jgi:hypothetical protein